MAQLLLLFLWWGRYQRVGLDGLKERSRAPPGGRVPAALYQPSTRPYPERVPELEYPDGFKVRRVRYNGEIRWDGEFIYLGQILAGEPVGLYQKEPARWTVYFGPLAIGRLHAITKRIEPLTTQPAHKLETMKKSVTHVPG